VSGATGDGETPAPLPASARRSLLNVLFECYPRGAMQTRLIDAPDSVVAWAVQNCLDDYVAADDRRAGANYFESITS